MFIFICTLQPVTCTFRKSTLAYTDEQISFKLVRAVNETRDPTNVSSLTDCAVIDLAIVASYDTLDIEL